MKNKMKLFKRITLILAALIILSGCELEQTEDIYIVFTNDVASEVDGEIGYAGVKGYRDHLLSEHRYVSLVDAGDFFDGEIGHAADGLYMVQIMNAVGYDVVTLGNQEFSIGLDALAKNIGESDFEYVSCNLGYIGNGKDPLSKVKPYTIKRYGFTRVAFIGVTTPETLIPGKPAYNAILEDGEPIYSFYGGNGGDDLYEQVQKTVDKIRKKADYVIVLAHLGMNSVKKGFSSYDLIENTTGIDVVIDAHSHTPNTGEAVANKEGKNVVLTSAGEKINYLGVLELHTDHTYTTTLYDSVYYKDSSITELIDEIKNETGY